MGNSTRFLVACHEERRNRVHQGLHQLSSRKKSTEQTKTPSIPHLVKYVFHTIHIHSHGLHCQTTPFKLLRYNTYYYRHLLKSVHLHTMQRNRKCRTNSKTIRYLRTPSLWTTTSYHLRSRPQIHISLF